MTVAVVGDGAVGLCGVLAASQLGAERVIAMSRHQPRQQLARDFGATDIVAERGGRRRSPGVRGHRRVDAASPAVHPARRDGRLGRCPARGGSPDPRLVLAE